MPTSWTSFRACHSTSTFACFACVRADIFHRGFDTEVGGKGSQLSGGQKRAFF